MSSGLYAQLSALDLGFDYMERTMSGELMSGGYLYVFDAESGRYPSTVDEVSEWLTERVGWSPLFHRRARHVPMSLDYPYWESVENLDPRRHVRLTEVAGPGWEALRTALLDAVYQPLDRSRPMWDLHVLTGIRNVDGLPVKAVGVLHRIHHTAADGMSNATLARVLFSRTKPDVDPVDPVTTPSDSVAVLRALARLPLALVRYGTRGVEFLRSERDPTTDGFDPHGLRPRTRFNQPLLGRATFGRAVFDVGEAKSVGKCLGVTLNDVMLATVAGALRSYLAERNELPAESLVADVPKTLRSADEATGGNAIITMYVPLHTEIADPVERVEAVHNAAEAEKNRARGPRSTAHRMMVESAPAPLLRLALRSPGAVPLEPVPLDEPTALSSTLVTNIPFGAPDLVFGDAPISDLFGIYEIRPGACLKHMVTSLRDRLSISVTADDVAMPDVARYCDLLTRSFEELRAAAALLDEPVLLDESE